MITYDRLFEIIAENDGTTRGDLADTIWKEIQPPEIQRVHVSCSACGRTLGWVAKADDTDALTKLASAHDCPLQRG